MFLIIFLAIGAISYATGDMVISQESIKEIESGAQVVTSTESAFGEIRNKIERVVKRY